MPKLVAHLGQSKGNQTSVWVLTEDKNLSGVPRDWRVKCGKDKKVNIVESIYDSTFRVALLIIERDEQLKDSLECNIYLSDKKTSIVLPKLVNNEKKPDMFSFLAYSCNEPFTTTKRDGQQGILNRDISLWARMHARSLGENSEGLLPYKPSFVLGLGDQIYVDPDPGEDNPLALFGGKESNKWFINRGKESYESAFRTIYRYNFSLPPLTESFSRLPSKMMWDDHEIRDGWGSHGDESNPVWQTYFEVARHAFLANQYLRGIIPGDKDEYQESYDLKVKSKDPLHHSFSHFDRTHFLMLDSRSKRSINPKFELFDDKSRGEVEKWLKKGTKENGDLYVLTVGVPLFPSKHLEDPASKLLPELKDDLMDAWGHKVNKSSQLALINMLKEHFKEHPNDRLLVLSGDVHFSSIFYLSLDEQDGRVFGHEVVTSGIAHSLPEIVMKINTRNEVVKPIDKVTVTPAGKINNSATFAEIIVRDNSIEQAPKIDLVFHSNGAKVGDKFGYFIKNKSDWVLANTNLLPSSLKKNSDKKTLWYDQYKYPDKQLSAHLGRVPSNKIPAGTIVSLDLELPDLIRDGKYVITYIQAQSVFCSVENEEYKYSMAKKWDLSKLDSCQKMTAK